MLEKIDHLGIAVKNLDEAVKFYTDILGLACVGRETVEGQKVKVAFIPIGESEIELLQSTDPYGPIARFIEKRGEGLQHIAVKVDDIEVLMEHLKEKGIRLLDEKPRLGAGGAKIAFIHPKDSKGVLIELCQR